MKLKYKILISILIALIPMILLINNLINEDMVNKKAMSSFTTNRDQTTTTTNTTTTTTTKTIKTTTKIKTTKKKVSNFNIKYNRNEVIEYAHQEVINKWGEDHWQAFYSIVIHESGWNPNNVNKKSGACGLFQLVPCSKGGSLYKTSWKEQIRIGILYIEGRYKDPNSAWKYWQKHHNY